MESFRHKISCKIVIIGAAAGVMLLSLFHSVAAAPVTYECGIAEGMAGILCCDSPEYNEALSILKQKYGADAKLDCIRPTSPDPENENYFANPMSCYLQEQGYNLGVSSCENAPLCELQRDTDQVARLENVGEIPERSKVFILNSLSGVSPELVKLTDKVEDQMCLPRGILLGMLTAESDSAHTMVYRMTGDPYQKLRDRRNDDQVAWGPANFVNSSWDSFNNIPGYGRSTGMFFGGVIPEKYRLANPVAYTPGDYITKNCLDGLGIDYSNPELWERDGKNEVGEYSYTLDRRVMGYALCSAATKMKRDSGTMDQCVPWSADQVRRAAGYYFGYLQCQAGARNYCQEWVGTICSLFPEDNTSICGGDASTEVKPVCIPKPPEEGAEEYNCNGQIKLLHPLRYDDPTKDVTQDYGNYNASQGGEHSGMDIKANIGTPVYAAAPGYIASFSRESLPGVGIFVKIAHDQVPGVATFWTSYQHMSRLAPNIQGNVRVSAGDLIGYVGTTGNSTGPHLHFEFRHHDCYDGYGDGKSFGSCSADPAPMLTNAQGVNSCTASGTPSPAIEGDFACPVNTSGPLSISQPSNGRGSHSLVDIKPQLPTDIYAPGGTVVAPTSGVIVEIVDPIETFRYFGNPMLCDGIRNSEGNLYYDGGFVVYIRSGDGKLWRLVHLEDIQVQEGQSVTVGDRIGKVYDGELSGEWAAFSASSKDNGGCFSPETQHLHFAIIDSSAADKRFPNTGYTYQFEGNTIDSTPWVKQYCKL